MESECQLELICSVVHVELYDFFSVCVSMCCSYSLKDSSEVYWSEICAKSNQVKNKTTKKPTQTTTEKAPPKST